MGIRYEINQSFFDIWSPQMAYILGFIYADGSIDHSPKIRADYLSITSTDKEIITEIRNTLHSKHRIVEIFPDTQKRKVKYLLRIGSKYICNKLSWYGLYPNKSLTAELQ